VYDISLHRLRVFKLVVEAGGIGAAAKELGISQPAVSAQMRSLESLVGQPLLSHRPGQPSELTDAGRVVYRYAHDVVAGAEDVLSILRDLNSGLRGKIAIAASRTLGHSMLAPILCEFHKMYPGTLVTVQTDTLAGITELLLSGHVSFALAITAGPIAQLKTEFIRTEPRVVLASPSHPLAKRHGLSSSDLAGENFIIGMRHSLNFLASANVLQDSGFAYDRVSVETNDYVLLKALVREGCGISVMPLHSAELELGAGDLVALDTSFDLPPLELRLAYVGAHRFAPSETRLAKLLCERLAHSNEIALSAAPSA